MDFKEETPGIYYSKLDVSENSTCKLKDAKRITKINSDSKIYKLNDFVILNKVNQDNQDSEINENDEENKNGEDYESHDNEEEEGKGNEEDNKNEDNNDNKIKLDLTLWKVSNEVEKFITETKTTIKSKIQKIISSF